MVPVFFYDLWLGSESITDDVPLIYGHNKESLGEDVHLLRPFVNVLQTEQKLGLSNVI